jgi:hypothetical protein
LACPHWISYATSKPRPTRKRSPPAKRDAAHRRCHFDSLMCFIRSLSKSIFVR